MHHRARRIPRERNRDRSALGHFRAGWDKPRGLQRRTHGVEIDWIGQYFQRSWYHVLRACLQCDRCDPDGVRAPRKGQSPDLVEQVAHRPSRGQIPTVLTDDPPQPRNRPIAIVSAAIDNERTATGAIGLDAEGFKSIRHRNPLEAAKLRRRQGKQAGMIARRRPEP